jgi:hypothetical protein
VYTWLYLLFFPPKTKKEITMPLLQKGSFFVPDYSCVICGDSALETRDHFFFAILLGSVAVVLEIFIGPMMTLSVQQPILNNQRQGKVMGQGRSKRPKRCHPNNLGCSLNPLPVLIPMCTSCV